MRGGVATDRRLPGELAGRSTEVFAEAAGDVEFQTDAAKVNTTGGWRDMKIGIFARRERGEPATPAEWDDRYLPAPTTRAAFAAIEAIDDFAPRWTEWAARLEIEDLTTITVLGDGAEWIWNAATRQFGGCHQLLDIYHAAEHIGTAAKRLFGEGAAADEWLERGPPTAAVRRLGRPLRPYGSDAGDGQQPERSARRWMS